MTRYTGPSPAVLALVKARDGGLCLRCGKPAVDIQHRIGRGAGGTRREIVNDPSALASVCRYCHDWIERGERGQAYVFGWAIRRSEPDLPSEIPLTDIWGAVFCLTEEATVIRVTGGGLLPEHPEQEEAPF